MELPPGAVVAVVEVVVEVPPAPVVVVVEEAGPDVDVLLDGALVLVVVEVVVVDVVEW